MDVDDVGQPVEVSARQHDCVVGCILGGAIGDAFGAAYEGQLGPVAMDDDYGWMLTDDTHLTLATCEAIVEQKSVDPPTIAKWFVSWFRQGKITGIGASTYKSLTELSAGAHWALAGRKGDHAAGNGAAMRIAPLAFCLDPQQPEDRRLIGDVCRITHHNDEAFAGAMAIATAVRAAWLGAWQGSVGLLDCVLASLGDSRLRDRIVEIKNSESSVSLQVLTDRFGCSGYVVESVPIALCAAQRVHTLGFERLMREIVSCGGDADTIASMTGQIVGALIGKQGLPNSMLACLPERQRVESIALVFAEFVNSNI